VVILVSSVVILVSSVVIQVSSAFYSFPGCFYRFSGFLHGYSGAHVCFLGGYLIFSVVTWGFLGGHGFQEFIMVSSVLYGFPGWFYGSLFTKTNQSILMSEFVPLK
jgi:hypothetical protein